MATQEQPLEIHVPARRQKPVRSRLGFFRGSSGMAGPEAALLALLFIGMGLMVGRVLSPAIKRAATNLNQELAGGVAP